MRTPTVQSSTPLLSWSVTKRHMDALTPKIQTPAKTPAKATPSQNTAPRLRGTGTPCPKNFPTVTRSTAQPRRGKPLSRREKQQIAESGARHRLVFEDDNGETELVVPIPSKDKEKEPDEQSLTPFPFEELVDTAEDVCLDKLQINTKAFQSGMEELQYGKILQEIVETSSQFQDTFRNDIHGFIESARSLPFYEYAEGTSILPKNHRLALDLSGNVLSLKTEPNTKPINKSENEALRSNNRRVYRAFQGFLLSQKRYKPSVIREIWRPNSDIEVSFMAGAPLTSQMIRDVICQAERLQIHYELVDESWEDSNPPINGLSPEDATALKDRFYREINSSRYIHRFEPVIWQPLTDSLLAKFYPKIVESLENKQTINAFLHFLKEINIHPSVVNYLFTKHFEPTFAVGKTRPTRKMLAAIYKEAHQLNYLRAGILDDATVQERLNAHFKDNLSAKSTPPSISPYIGKWNSLLTKIGLGQPDVVPNGPQQAEENRQAILDLFDYIASKYQSDIAEVLWPKLELFFKLGIKPNSTHVLSLLHQPEILATETTERIQKYIESRLADVPLVHKVYGDIPEQQMQRLRRRVERSAVHRALKNGGVPLSFETLHAIAQKCHASTCAEAVVGAPPRKASADSILYIQWKARYKDKRDAFLQELKSGKMLSWQGAREIVVRPKSSAEIQQEKALKKRIKATDVDTLVAKAKINQWTQTQKSQNQSIDNPSELLENITLKHLAARSAPEVGGSIATAANMGGMMSDFSDVGKYISPNTALSNYTFITTLEPPAAGLGAGAAAAIIEGVDYRNKKQLHDQLQTKREQLRQEYRAWEIIRSAFQYAHRNYHDETIVATILNLTPEQEKPRQETLRDWIDEVTHRMNDIQGELLQKNLDQFNTSYQWTIPTSIATNILASFSSGNFLLGNVTAPLAETASTGFLTAASGGFITGGTLNSISNTYATYESYRKEKNSLRAKAKIQKALERNFSSRTKELIDFNKIDHTAEAHGKYRQNKAASAWVSWGRNTSKSIAAKSFISDDPYGAILRSIHDHQRDRDHSFQKKLNGVKATGSILGTASISYLFFSELSTGAAASVTTAVGSFAIAGVASMGVSILLGGLGFFGLWYYRRRSETAKQLEIEHWRQAYRYHTGPCWEKLKKKNLTDDEAEAIALAKLYQKDLDLSLTKMATDLQAEYGQTQKPNTDKIKRLLSPHEEQDPNEMDPEKLRENYLLVRDIDLLASLTDTEKIKLLLHEMLIPEE